MGTRIERRDVGFGRYQWYLNGEVDERVECEIINSLPPTVQQRIFCQLNYYGSVNIEF